MSQSNPALIRLCTIVKQIAEWVEMNVNLEAKLANTYREIRNSRWGELDGGWGGSTLLM